MIYCIFHHILLYLGRGDNTFGSVHSSIRTGAEWSILVFGFAKYSKRSSETQVNYTLKEHHRVCIARSIQNGWVFKMVVVATGCAIAVDHAFNIILLSCYDIGILICLHH